MSSQRHENSTSNDSELLTVNAPESNMDVDHIGGGLSPIVASSQNKGKEKAIADATASPRLGSSRADSPPPSPADLLAEIQGWRRQLEEVTVHLENIESDTEMGDSDEYATPSPSPQAQTQREQTAFYSPNVVASFLPPARPQGPSRPQALLNTTTRAPTPSPSSHPTIPWHTRRPRGCTTLLANYVTMDPGFTPDALGHRSLGSSSVSLSGHNPRATIRTRATWAIAAPSPHGLVSPAHDSSHVNSTNDLRNNHSTFRSTSPHRGDVRQAPSPQDPAGSSNTTVSPTSSLPLQGLNIEAVLLRLSTDMRELRTEMLDMRQTIQQVGDNNNSHSRPSRQKKNGTKDERPRNPQRNLMMHTVRTSMNDLIGIKVDEQITQDGVAARLIVDPELLQQLEARTLEEIPLEPLMIDWDNPRSEWNVGLSEAFAKRLVVPDGCTWSQGDIARHFLQRIETLTTLLRKHLPKSADENPDTLAAQLKARKDATMKVKRSRKRQATRAKTRADIAIAGSQGGRNAAWTALLRLVQILKIDGHSSDETDHESGGLLVHTPGWRHSYVSDLLRFIDNNKNTRNEYGNSIGGAQPLVRHRNKRHILSRRPYMPHLPNNLYDPGWLGTLSEYSKEHEVQPQDDALSLPRLLSPEISPRSHVVI